MLDGEAGPSRMADDANVPTIEKTRAEWKKSIMSRVAVRSWTAENQYLKDCQSMDISSSGKYD